MLKFTIASHGNLASGFKSSVGIIMGDDVANKLTAINAFTDVKDPKQAIQTMVDELAEDDQMIIFSDWMNGSVNQLCTPHVTNGKVFVVSGTNLPILCEVLGELAYSDQRVNEDSLRSAVSRAKEEVIYVNDRFNNSDDHSLTDEEDFF